MVMAKICEDWDGVGLFTYSTIFSTSVGHECYGKMFPPGTFRIFVVILFVFGVIVPLFIQVVIQLSPSTVKDESLFLSQNILFEQLELKKEKVEALEKHLRELEDIRIKALHGLQSLDGKRVKLQNEISQASKRTASLKDEERLLKKQIEKAKKDMEHRQLTKIHKTVTNVVYVGLPHKSQHQRHQQHQRQHQQRQYLSNYSLLDGTREHCDFNSCFDYSRCTMLREFTLHVAWPHTARVHPLYSILTTMHHNTADITWSCLSVLIVDMTQTTKHINDYLGKNPSWKSSHNNMVILLSGTNKQKQEQHKNHKDYCSKVKELNLNNAILVLNAFCPQSRSQFDFVLPDFELTLRQGVYKPVPLYPLRRKYLLTFASEFMNSKKPVIKDSDYVLEFGDKDDIVVTQNCDGSFQSPCLSGTWCPCDLHQGWREALLLNSLFTLIIVDRTNPLFVNEIINAFSSGAIPVLTGVTDFLPFSDLIDWKRAAVLIPSQRLPELELTLRSIAFDDLVTMKLQGNFIYETYLSSQTVTLSTILAYIRNGIALPPKSVDDFQAVLLKRKVTGDHSEDSSNVPSHPKHVNNYSYVGKNEYLLWNQYPGGLQMYPVTPWNNPPPSRVQFLDEGKDHYMPIGDGLGGDGVAFSRSLGGDYPVEEFTIVMLTYDREAILMEALQRLSGMKYLNKIVVVWNHPVDPAADLEWPDIGVELEIIRAGKNSLNNRFLPYDAVNTEAILSMDDDIYLRHDEIELAFRIWRENRARLVGFPGRHHAYNSTSKSFYYNSEHSCELSLVLTGGAFFHKYYSYVYTHNMNPLIHKMVDEYMNCEDIAMNFLVAHITKKPPIKVTSRWTFRCPECPVALSTDAHHYEERNTCMSYFEHLYGYNPLKRTQFRADSILFKTRIPSTMKKCFQFV